MLRMIFGALKIFRINGYDAMIKGKLIIIHPIYIFGRVFNINLY